MATILVADDRAANRQYLATLLGYRNHRVIEAADGAKALALAQAERPDLIITDLVMPVMDGLELVRQLRTVPELAQVPIIVSTATYLDREARALAQSLNVPHVLMKPAEAQTVFDMVEAALHQAPPPETPAGARQVGGALQALSAKLASKTGELQLVSAQLAELLDLSWMLSQERDRDRLLEVVCSAAREIVNVNLAGVYIQSEESSPAHLVYCGPQAGTPAWTFGEIPADSLIGRAMDRQAPVRDRASDTRPIAAGLPASHPPFNSLMAVPLKTPTQLYGALYLADVQNRDDFSLDDEKLAVALAAQVAVAYENATLYDDLQRHAATLQLEVAERRQAEAALRLSEARLSGMIDTAMDAIIAVDSEQHVMLFNNAAESTFGYSGAEVMGKPLDTLLPPQSRTVHRVHVDRFGRTGISERTHHRMMGNLYGLHADGHQFPIEAAISKVESNGQNLYTVILRDESERRRIETELRYSEERSRALIEHSADAVALIGADGEIRFCSPAALQILGYPVDEFIGSNVLSYIHPEDRANNQAMLRALLEKPGAVSTGQFRYRHRNGSWRWVEATRTNLLDNPSVGAIVVNYRDITERLEMEAALRQSEEHFRALIENSSEGILLIDQTGKRLYASPSTERITGYPLEQLMQAGPGEYIHPEDRPGLIELLEKLIAQPGTVVSIRYRFQHRDGSWRWIESSINNLLAEPSVQAIVFNYHDITQRVLAETALRESEERYRSMVDSAADLISIVTLEGSLININPAFEAITGFKVEDWLGKPIAELIHPDDLQEAGVNTLRVIEGSPVPPYEVRSLTKQGDYRTLEFTATAQRRDGQVVAIQAVGRDVTERKLRDREIAAIAAISSALRTATTRADMLPIILDEVILLLDAGAANFSWLEEATGDTVVALHRGKGIDRTGFRVPAGQGLTPSILASGEPYLNNNFAAEPRLWQPVAAIEYKAALAVPLISQGQSIGVLWVERDRAFSNQEVRLLGAIGDIAANAIRRAGLFEETERRLRRLTALRTIDLAISSSFDLRLTLDVLLDQVIRELDVEAASVLLLNQYSHELEFAAARGFRGRSIQQSRVRMGSGYAGRAALERRTVTVADLNTAEPMIRAKMVAEEGFQAYIVTPLVSKAETEGVLEVFHRSPLFVNQEWVSFLEAVAGQAAIAVDNARLFQDLKASNIELMLAYDTTLEGWSRALDLRDHETEGHSQRVTEMTVTLAREMGLDDQALAQVRRGALLHDIGKMGIPDGILLKPGPLTDEEWVVMRRHPTYAYDLLQPILFLRNALDIPYCHHEKWDGSGYPRGLSGEQIPLAARIFAVVDVWDALSSDRSYRAAWPRDRVRELISSEAGKHFDPAVVEAFLRVVARAGD